MTAEDKLETNGIPILNPHKKGWIVNVLSIFSYGDIENRSRYSRARRNEGDKKVHVKDLIRHCN